MPPTPRESVELRVATWNVLHHVHALNWNEDAVAAHADERARMEAISARAAAWLRHGDVLCLQEVSGDQLVSLSAALAPAAVITHRFPRVPVPRHGPSALVDPAEYLVVAARAPTHLASATFADDPGKGYLAAEVHGAVVVCTHVSYGAKGQRQLQELAAFAGRPGRAVIAGDFNAELDAVRACLGPGFAALDADGLAFTRRATGGKPGHTIDHIVVAGGRADAAEVVDSGGLSDHNLLAGRISAG